MAQQCYGTAEEGALQEQFDLSGRRGVARYMRYKLPCMSVTTLSTLYCEARNTRLTDVVDQVVRDSAPLGYGWPALPRQTPEF